MTQSDSSPDPAPEDKVKLAVALSYDPSSDAAPRVVAHGKGELAERILSLAFSSGVKVREDADLAQILASVDIDRAIPTEAFWAVAEILAYVYRANQIYTLDESGVSP